MEAYSQHVIDYRTQEGIRMCRTREQKGHLVPGYMQKANRVSSTFIAHILSIYLGLNVLQKNTITCESRYAVTFCNMMVGTAGHVISGDNILLGAYDHDLTTSDECKF